MSRLNNDELQRRIDQEFLSMPMRPSTMTYYTVRSAILSSVKRETVDFYGAVLDVGCGFMPYRSLIESLDAVESYAGLDVEEQTYYFDVAPDLVWDGRSIPAPNGSFDCVMATEFLEHIADPMAVLTEITRVMKPGGKLFATVPFIWNLHELPYDEFRYTPTSLDRILVDAGLSEVRIDPLAGWNAALAQMVGLWLGFSPIRGHTRTLLRYLLFPFYAALVRSDVLFAGFDGGERSMFTGLTAVARKPLQQK